MTGEREGRTYFVAFLVIWHATWALAAMSAGLFGAA
jgi:hypothetical protein